MERQCVNVGLAEKAETKLPAGWVVHSWGWDRWQFLLQNPKGRAPDAVLNQKQGVREHSIRAWEKEREHREIQESSTEQKRREEAPATQPHM